MRVVFRKRAEADLRGIIAWFDQVAPESVQRILDDIYRSIDFLIDSPRLGMPIEGTPFTAPSPAAITQDRLRGERPKDLHRRHLSLSEPDDLKAHIAVTNSKHGFTDPEEDIHDLPMLGYDACADRQNWAAMPGSLE